MLSFIDTHCHLDGEEFAADLDEVVARAREAGVTKVLVPGIDLKSCQTVLDLCSQYPGYCYPMLGLHPEEVRSDWPEILAQLKSSIFHHPSPIIHHPSSIIHHPSPITHHPSSPSAKSASTSIGAASSNRSSWRPSRSRCAGR